MSRVAQVQGSEIDFSFLNRILIETVWAMSMPFKVIVYALNWCEWILFVKLFFFILFTKGIGRYHLLFTLIKWSFQGYHETLSTCLNIYTVVCSSLIFFIKVCMNTHIYAQIDILYLWCFVPSLASVGRCYYLLQLSLLICLETLFMDKKKVEGKFLRFTKIIHT